LSRALDLGIGQIKAGAAVALQPIPATCCEDLQVVAILRHVPRVLLRAVVPCGSTFDLFRSSFGAPVGDQLVCQADVRSDMGEHAAQPFGCLGRVEIDVSSGLFDGGDPVGGGGSVRQSGHNVRVLGSASEKSGNAGRPVFLVDLDEGRSLFDLVALTDELGEALGVEVNVLTEGSLRPTYVRPL
jgi:hypothetical protein